MDQGDRGDRPARTRRERVRPVDVILGIAGIALLVPFLARLTGIEAGPLAYASAFTPWFTVAWLVLLLIAAVARRWAVLAAVAVPAAVSVAWALPMFTAAPASADADVTVATVNATFGQVDPAEVVAMVAERDIDLLAVQELTPESLEALLDAGLADELPYWSAAAASGFTGLGVWSATPLAVVETLDGFVSHTVYATAELGGETVTVLAAHPAAPGLLAHTSWLEDLALLEGAAEDTAGPMMIVGDLNTTRDHEEFRALEADGFVDAADDAGAGFLPTFPEGRLPFPVVAIDHVMVRDLEWTASSVETVSLTGADHRALIVEYDVG